MPAIEPLWHSIGLNCRHISKGEQLILEAQLFSLICAKLKENFKNQFSEYYRLLKLPANMESEMLEADFTKLVINDILQTQEYTIEGLATYTGIHEDIIHEVIAGRNSNPSAILLQKAIDVHRSVRSDLYQSIIQKIISENFSGNDKNS